MKSEIFIQVLNLFCYSSAHSFGINSILSFVGGNWIKIGFPVEFNQMKFATVVHCIVLGNPISNPQIERRRERERRQMGWETKSIPFHNKTTLFSLSHN